MAYSTSNPPYLLVQGTGGKGSQWGYDSADAATVVRALNYITDALDLGMKVGDTVQQIDSAGGTVSHKYIVLAVIAAGADLSDGDADTLTNT